MSLPASAGTAFELGTSSIVYDYELLESTAMTPGHTGKMFWYEHAKPYGESAGKVSLDSIHYRGNLFSHVVSGPSYIGYTQDQQTDLMYMKAWQYDLDIGRFYFNESQRLFENNPDYFNRHSYATSHPSQGEGPAGEVVAEGVGGVFGEFLFDELWEGVTGRGDGTANWEKADSVFANGYDGNRASGNNHTLANNVDFEFAVASLIVSMFAGDTPKAAFGAVKQGLNFAQASVQNIFLHDLFEGRSVGGGIDDDSSRSEQVLHDDMPVKFAIRMVVKLH